ncbi:MAG: TetR/AcrR family transcriptional regulator [Gammaproteobacteria bacterium]|nr:TetR/AcrR family transcriptional regulator [Gammaproteobacteria bacterium]
MTQQQRTVAAGHASPWHGGRRRRDRALKRDAVIRAAARAFRERGYHNTSLDDIAAALGVTKPTLYYYVRNKQDLLFECFQAGLAGIGAAFDEARRSHGNGRERLRIVLRGYALAIASEFGWCMVRAEDQDLDAAMSARIRARKGEIDRQIRALIQQGTADGSIRDCDAKITAFAIAGALNWIAHWHRESEALAAADIADRFIGFFEDGLRPRR